MAEMLQGAIREIMCEMPSGKSLLSIEGDEGTPFRAIGDRNGTLKGESVNLHGLWSAHEGVGRIFEFDSIRSTAPLDTSSQIDYIARSLDLAHPEASAIATHFGDSAFTILDTRPERLSELPQFDAARAKILGERWKTARRAARGESVAVRLKLSQSEHERLLARLGIPAEGLADKLAEDPFCAYLALGTVSYAESVKLANEHHISPGALPRVRGAVMHALRYASTNGHTFVPAEDMARRVRFSLRWRGSELPDIDAAIKSLMDDGYIAKMSGRVYLPQLMAAEATALDSLTQLEREEQTFTVPGSAGRIPVAIESRFGRKLPPNLAKFARDALSHKVCLVDGEYSMSRPIVRAIVDTAAVLSLNVRVLSTSLEQAKFYEAHSPAAGATVVEYIGMGADGSSRRTGDHRENDVDLFVVDGGESLDIETLSGLLRAIPESASLVICGDKAMAPNLGPGRPYRDLIETRRLPVLRNPLKSSKDSPAGVMRNLLAGHSTVRAHEERLDRAVSVLRVTPDQLLERLGKIARNIAPQYKVSATDGFAVLTPTMKGLKPSPDEITAHLRSIFNPGAEALPVGFRELAVDDPAVVSTLIERPALGAATRLQVSRVAGSNDVSAVHGDDSFKLSGANAERIEPAYLTGTYRALSSRFKVAVLLVPESCREVLLHRDLLYSISQVTTRHLFILCSPLQISKAVDNEAPQIFSGFAEMINERRKRAAHSD